ncbi:hypothetical protein PR048_014050 [Dryococelus australis]|uniref:Uncharacterized protein n=1 Tax=Dryococelus australis TaxID=614101 RepID=A0ABQ9HTX1_9NEOP|nr:hypothetical protein PR048_014050 [Dryococelus australis]
MSIKELVDADPYDDCDILVQTVATRLGCAIYTTHCTLVHTTSATLAPKVAGHRTMFPGPLRLTAALLHDGLPRLGSISSIVCIAVPVKVHSLVDSARLWERALCLISYNVLPKIPYWLGFLRASRIPAADWRTMSLRNYKRAAFQLAHRACVMWSSCVRLPHLRLHLIPTRWACVPCLLARRRGGLVARLLASHTGRKPGSNSCWVAPGFSQVGIVPDDAGWSAVFFSLGDLPFPPPLHSGAAPLSPRFTLIGSRVPYVESRKNLFAHPTSTHEALSTSLAGFLGDLPFPPPFNSSATPYSPRPSSSALNTSLLTYNCDVFVGSTSLRKISEVPENNWKPPCRIFTCSNTQAWQRSVHRTDVVVFRRAGAAQSATILLTSLGRLRAPTKT